MEIHCGKCMIAIIFVATISSVMYPSYHVSSTQLPAAAARIRNEPDSVWAEFTELALKYKPLNLGQGFPDFAAPRYLIESLQNATQIDGPKENILHNQYTRSFGHPRLIKALVAYYNEFRGFAELVNPNEQVIVTVGAYEAIFASIMAFVEPNDEVIIIEPAFDAYAPLVALAQGRPVFIPLQTVSPDDQSKNSLSSADFKLDMKEFESKVSNRTKMLVLNTPNNPLGKIYSISELKAIADICIKHNILVLADEVYEQMYYSEEERHVSIASLAGMWARTITVGSAGKSFSVTGWKIGWAFGPKHLIRYVQLVHQTAIYTVATPLQEAVARALGKSRAQFLGIYNFILARFRAVWVVLFAKSTNISEISIPISGLESPR